MPLYIDLFPSPQFDRSLPTYCAINFQRIRDALLFAGKRVEFSVVNLSGGWAEPGPNINVAVPYTCDVVIWTEMTFYAPVPGMAGRYVKWDSTFLPITMEMTFNEANSHKRLAVTNTVRNVNPGNHVYTTQSAHQFVQSDGNDRFHTLFTFYER